VHDPEGEALTLAARHSAGCGGSDNGAVDQAALVAQGQQIFRFDTFGDEAHWTDTLRMHEVISAAVDPVTALLVGLKVDAEALPTAVVRGIQNGSIDLHSPATTVALLKLDAVVGLKGTVESIGGQDVLTHVGITCALCHSTVDNSFAPGIGKRLDGWPNRDMNPGVIIALSPAADATTRAALNAWGAGKFDPRHDIDGLSKPVVIPPAFGLNGVHSVTYTGDGTDLAYWNRYVAVAEMGGLGSVSEPRLNLGITHGSGDLVSSKLPALQAYQLSIGAPTPPAGSFDAAAAARGKGLRGAGPMRDVSPRGSVHRCQQHLASPRRFHGRTRDTELRLAFGYEAIPDHAAARPLAARAVLSRWLGGNAERRGRHVQQAQIVGPVGAAVDRPRRIPEVALTHAASRALR
jgi:hypothetical protein